MFRKLTIEFILQKTFANGQLKYLKSDFIRKYLYFNMPSSDRDVPYIIVKQNLVEMHCV